MTLIVRTTRRKQYDIWNRQIPDNGVTVTRKVTPEEKKLLDERMEKNRKYATKPYGNFRSGPQF